MHLLITARSGTLKHRLLQPPGDPGLLPHPKAPEPPPVHISCPVEQKKKEALKAFSWQLLLGDHR